MARRKRVTTAGGGNDDEVNLTPMLDVVFILLIFFIVTAQFIKEPGPEIDRVGVNVHQAVKPLAILIAIDEDSNIWIDKEIVESTEIAFKIRELREDNPNGKLVVQPDAESEARALVELMDVIAETDGRNPINISIERN
ncbi:MAG: biopolymer transporter ExbD [Hyphomonadaceae bacterium]